MVRSGLSGPPDFLSSVSGKFKQSYTSNGRVKIWDRCLHMYSNPLQVIIFKHNCSLCDSAQAHRWC